MTPSFWEVSLIFWNYEELQFIWYLPMPTLDSAISPRWSGTLSEKLFTKQNLDMLVAPRILLLLNVQWNVSINSMSFDRFIYPWSILSLHCTWSISCIWYGGPHVPPRTVAFARLPGNDALSVSPISMRYSFSWSLLYFLCSLHTIFKLGYCRTHTLMLFSSVPKVILIRRLLIPVLLIFLRHWKRFLKSKIVYSQLF